MAPASPTAHERLATVWEVKRGLTSVLHRLLLDPGRWILIIEDAQNRYVQFLAFEDGSLVAETVSNLYLSDAKRWTEEAEAALTSPRVGATESAEASQLGRGVPDALTSGRGCGGSCRIHTAQGLLPRLSRRGHNQSVELAAPRPYPGQRDIACCR